jgi:hypothetical protein
MENNNLFLRVKPELVPYFYQLLGQGFRIQATTGCSIKELLHAQLGIHEDYIDQRIQTIFMNSKVVDDMAAAVVIQGSTLALSGAMPGLVGAILRSGGYLAAMRSQISHTKSESTSEQTSSTITLKLLNMVVKELGPNFLQNGVGIRGSQFKEFVERNWDEIRSGCLAVEWNDQAYEPDSVPGIDFNADLINLRVSADPNP